ncbi:hypothetical protein LCGC14_1588830 [marine sediment metagenome]|uniref:YopX protein domain-containing protein n=1 Tax=marine sediment metagenome TaxID=412755 RepID=A0A0F9IF11_9ZZZZ
MREIKFRAWGTWRSKSYRGKNMQDVQEMFYQIGFHIEEFFRKIRTHCIKWELMQFTGLKDKNGKEIYEGDILYMKHKRGKWWSKGKVLVVFENCEFYAEKIDEGVIEDEESLGNYRFKEYNLEVLGNKFENPELLDAKGDKSE